MIDVFLPNLSEMIPDNATAIIFPIPKEETTAAAPAMLVPHFDAKTSMFRADNN